jgi:hypothetical protein
MDSNKAAVWIAAMTMVVIFAAGTCSSDMDAEHCITVCNARVESYNDITTQCECRR